MNQSSRIKSSNSVEFGPFSFDLDAHLLSRGGETLPLKRQSAAVLAMLVSAGGSVVTRAAIRDAVWHDRTIEFDDGINACVRDIRRVIGDSSKNPIYIETIPKNGYRLKAETTGTVEGSAVGSGVSLGDGSGGVSRRKIVAACGLLVAMLVVFLVAGRPNPAPSAGERGRIAVMPFTAAEVSVASSDQSEALTNLFVAMLAENQSKILVISIGELFAGDDSQPGMGDVSRWLSVDYLLAGSVAGTAGQKSLTLRVVRTDGYVHLWSKTLPMDAVDPTATARKLFGEMLEVAREENGDPLFRDGPES